MAYFSVVVPVYNKEKELSETLQSALSQTFADFELLLVNDGSTDHSGKIAKSFADPRIRYFENPNQGVSAARNFGIQKAASKMIAFLDADDFWFPDHLQRLFQLCEVFPEFGLYATSYDHFYSEKHIATPHFPGISPNHFGPVPDFFKASLVHRIAWTSAVAVPKKILEAMGGFNPGTTYGEDLELWIKIAIRHAVAFDAKVSARHHLNASNRISKREVRENAFAELTAYDSEAKKNPSLKAFLDQYRAEFALKHKIAGDVAAFKKYASTLDQKQLSYKTKLLFALPPLLLRILFYLKKAAEKKGILIDPYH